MLTALCIWLGVKVNQARRQKEAVAALKALGTGFYYARQRDDAYPNSIAPDKELVVPKWLEELAGYDFFRTVISVQGSGPVSDEDLSHLAGLPYIERLYVTGFGNNVLNWELDQLRRPDRQIASGARGNNVSDAGLAHLRRVITFGATDTLIGDGFVKRLRNATHHRRRTHPPEEREAVAAPKPDPDKRYRRGALAPARLVGVAKRSA